jgi:peptidoglycan/xylan/chitin deacetylase (PgdA/CDA1 family)
VEQELYRYSPINERPPLAWPEGNRVAFYLGLNIEHYLIDRPSTSTSPATVGLTPDPMNYGWRDYGVRVGVWRAIELLDRLEIPASVLLNSDVCRFYPQIMKAIAERDWVCLGHGQNNSTLQTAMDEDAERDYLTEMVRVIESTTGSRPHGWLGPALTETFNTPRLLRELGFSYVVDWCNDDQPYPLDVDGMVSVPYAQQLNDISLFVSRSYSGAEYVQMVCDHLDQLLAEGETAGRVMALAIHPFVINQPALHRYLAQALEEVKARDGVWITTADAIAEHYLTTEHAQQLAGAPSAR